jgi:hypothetical protein
LLHIIGFAVTSAPGRRTGAAVPRAVFALIGLLVLTAAGIAVLC